MSVGANVTRCIWGLGLSGVDTYLLPCLRQGLLLPALSAMLPGPRATGDSPVPISHLAWAGITDVHHHIWFRNELSTVEEPKCLKRHAKYQSLLETQLVCVSGGFSEFPIPR